MFINIVVNFWNQYFYFSESICIFVGNDGGAPPL